MYNSEQKQNYLRYKAYETDHTNTIECRFEEIASYEEELQKDLCDFTHRDIEAYYIRVNHKNVAILANMNSAYKGYTHWCITNGLTLGNVNYYEDFSTEVLNKYVNSLLKEASYISREELLIEISRLPNPRDQFALLAIFEYGKSKNLMDVGLANIYGLDGNRFTLPSGRTVDISNKLREIIIEANAAQKYFANKDERVLFEDGTLIKATRQSAYTDAKNVGVKVSKIIKRALGIMGYEGILSVHALSEAGKLHMIKTLMKKYDMSMKELLESEHKKEIEAQYGCKIISCEYLYRFGDNV